MKKFYFLLVAAALLLGTAANAQDVFKQQGSERNIELLFAPLGGNPFTINGIKYRQFTSATTAWRATVFAGFSSSTDKTIAGEGDNEEELKMVDSEFNISIAPGIEKHFAGTDRLSPYIGGEAVVAFQRMTMKEEFLVGDDIEEGTTKDGNLTFGVNGFFGFDFYFADNIYLGGELGFGVQFTSEFDTVMESTVEGAEDMETPNGSSFSIGPNVVGQIRAGVLF